MLLLLAPALLAGYVHTHTCVREVCMREMPSIHACQTGPAVRAHPPIQPNPRPPIDWPTNQPTICPHPPPPPNKHTHSIASAQSFRGATIVAKDPSTEPAMQEGVWYGPEALLPWDVVYNNDKRVRGWGDNRKMRNWSGLDGSQTNQPTDPNKPTHLQKTSLSTPPIKHTMVSTLLSMMWRRTGASPPGAPGRPASGTSSLRTASPRR